jgi:hypothetical protein
VMVFSQLSLTEGPPFGPVVAPPLIGNFDQVMVCRFSSWFMGFL